MFDGGFDPQDFSKWEELLGDDTLATAILDRLLHHAIMVSLNGPSFRLKEKRRAGIIDRFRL
jgi:DNA replication protein DnaC